MIRDANKLLENEPGLARRVASMVAGRLDATSALLVELSKQNKGKASEQGLLSRILATLYTPAPGEGGEIAAPNAPKSVGGVGHG